MSAYTDLIANPNAEKCLICHLQPFDPVAAAAVDLYYSTHGFTSAPGDSPANTSYPAVLLNDFEFSRTMFDGVKLSGQSIPGVGTLTLLDDGRLRPLLNYSWAGQPVSVWLGGPDFALSDYGDVFHGTADGVESVDGKIIVRLRDLRYRLEREIQTNKFVGSGGAEGGTDVAGRRKPLVLGLCREVPLLYIGKNGGKHTFLVEGPIVGILRVRDKGLEYTFVSGTPGPGQFTYDCATGLVTLGGSYVGPITADVIGYRYQSTTSTTSWAVGTGSKAFTVASVAGLAVGMQMRAARTSALHATGGDGKITNIAGLVVTVNVTSTFGSGTHTDWTLSPWGTVAGITKYIGTRCGITSFDSASFTTMDAALPATAGHFVPDGGTALSHLDTFLTGASCHQGFTRVGAWQIGRLAAPATPDSEFFARDIILNTLRGRATSDPCSEVTVRYAKVWSGARNSAELLGAVSDADRAFLTQEWRQVVDSNSSILTAFPEAQPITVDSPFDEAADATTEAARLKAIWGVQRRAYTAVLKTKPLTLDIGGTSTLTHSEIDAPADFVRTAVKESLARYEVTCEFWGALNV